MDLASCPLRHAVAKTPRTATGSGLVPLTLLAVVVACGSGPQSGEPEEPSDLGPSPDSGTAFDAVLSSVRLEVTLRGGWFARVVLSSDSREVRVERLGNFHPILDVGYHRVAGYLVSECQPREGQALPGDCVLLTSHCDCADPHRCVCAHDQKDVPDHLFVAPSEWLAAQNYGLENARLEIALEGSDAARVRFMDFEVPERFVLCEGDRASMTWVTAEGLDILLANQFSSEVILYRDKDTTWPFYDYSKDFCVVSPVQSAVAGRFSFDLSFESLAPCGTDKPVRFRPVAYRDFPLDDQFAAGSLVRAGLPSEGFLVEPRTGCGTSTYDPWPNMSEPVLLSLEDPQGAPFSPADAYPGGILEVIAPKEGGFLLDWRNFQADRTHWSRYLEETIAFDHVRDTPTAFRQAEDGSWVGVYHGRNAIFRKNPDDSWTAAGTFWPEGVFQIPEEDRLEAVAEADGVVVALFSNYGKGEVRLVSPLGDRTLQDSDLCPGVEKTPPRTRANTRLIPAKGGAVVVRTACVGGSGFGLFDSTVDVASGTAQTGLALDWQELPAEGFESAWGLPAFLDDELVVFAWSRKQDGRLAYRVYRAVPGRTAEGLILEGVLPGVEKSPHPEVGRVGDELFFGWPATATGPITDAGEPRVPVVAVVPMSGSEVRVGAAPKPPGRTAHVRAARDRSGRLHVFPVGDDLTTWWSREE